MKKATLGVVIITGTEHVLSNLQHTATADIAGKAFSTLDLYISRSAMNTNWLILLENARQMIEK